MRVAVDSVVARTKGKLLIGIEAECCRVHLRSVTFWFKWRSQRCVHWDKPGATEKSDICTNSSDSFLFISLLEVEINGAPV